MIAELTCRPQLPGKPSSRCERRRLDKQRAEALERLIAILEAGAEAVTTESHADMYRSPDRTVEFSPDRSMCRGAFYTTHVSRNSKSQLARLRAAHAAYALATGPMQRVSRSAWIRHRAAGAS